MKKRFKQRVLTKRSKERVSTVRSFQQRIISDCLRVNWNIKNREGDTPLMHCVKDCNTEMARILLNNPKVDLDTVDCDGRHLEDIAR